jgi:hypothetical protein
VEKCGRARQAADGNKVRCVCFACWVTTHAQKCNTYCFSLVNVFLLYCTYIACVVGELMQAGDFLIQKCLYETHVVS